MRGNQVLPAAQVIGVADRVHRALVGHAQIAEAHHVHAHAVQLADGLPGVGSSVSGQHAGRDIQQIAIEREAVLHRRLRARSASAGGVQSSITGLSFCTAGGAGLWAQPCMLNVLMVSAAAVAKTKNRLFMAI